MQLYSFNITADDVTFVYTIAVSAAFIYLFILFNRICEHSVKESSVKLFKTHIGDYTEQSNLTAGQF
jgi:TRAP-type uncharacterized transport system fused permease subunit